MNVDTQFPPAPITPLAGRPTQARTDQDSARPVDRPHHAESANNHGQQKADPAPNPEEQRRPADQPPAARPESELSAEQKRELRAQEQDSDGAGTQSSTVRQTGDRLNNTTEPAAVGELLDVLV
jgi:hypothetical protein